MTETHFRRITAGSAVLLLHVVLLIAFLLANCVCTIPRNPPREIEIAFAPTVAKRSPTVVRALEPKFLSPTVPVLPAIPGELVAPHKALPVPGAISGVSRALFGCEPQKLHMLSPQDQITCLSLPRGTTPLANVRMPPPPDPGSPFTKEIQERFREATPINRPCPLGSFNDTHGLPCFGFPGGDPVSPQH